MSSSEFSFFPIWMHLNFTAKPKSAPNDGDGNSSTKLFFGELFHVPGHWVVNKCLILKGKKKLLPALKLPNLSCFSILDSQAIVDYISADTCNMIAAIDFCYQWVCNVQDVVSICVDGSYFRSGKCGLQICYRCQLRVHCNWPSLLMICYQVYSWWAGRRANI